MSVPHPIPYQGSKRNLAPQILRYFPDNVNRLIEPFAGSAALSLAATNRNLEFVFNDVNTSLITLWDAILHHPNRLADYYEKLWYTQLGREREFYDLVRRRFNQTHQPYYFLYLLARCVKAAVRYNAHGEFNQSPDNRRKGRQPQTMRKDIMQASARLKGRTTLMACDYKEVLQCATSDDLVYLDPPYQGVCATRDPRYIQGVDYDEFIQQLAHLNRRHVAYILSYDGRTGDKKFGQPLPASLELTFVEINAGRSSQATLLGKNATTYEALYLSPALSERLSPKLTQMSLFVEPA